MTEHCRTCQRALDSRWDWEDGRPVRVVACPRCDRVGRVHQGQRFGAVFQHRGPDRLGEQDGQRVVADGGVTADQLTECWCCDYYTERGSLCKDCEDAGCDRFGDSCEVDS